VVSKEFLGPEVLNEGNNLTAMEGFMNLRHCTQHTDQNLKVRYKCTTPRIDAPRYSLCKELKE
jgi:hypothetical protein